MKKIITVISTAILLGSIPLQGFGSITYQKGAGDNVLNYPIQEGDMESLGENTLWQGYTIDDSRVKISEQWLEENQGPQQGTKAFDAEMLITAYGTKLAKDEVRFSDKSINRKLFEVNGLDSEQEFISDVVRKYDVNTAGDLARLVHKDRPTQLIDDAILRLDKRGAKRRPGLLMETAFGRQFTETTVCDEALAGAMVLHTSYSAFAAKYYYGFPRPEEVFHGIVTDEYEVEASIKEVLSSLYDEEQIKQKMEMFTMYPEGAPNHPARPAMHSSVASILYMLSILYELDDYEKDQILRLQSNIAFGRTLAGVHWPYDNINGMNLGIEIMKNGLMKELLEMSGVEYDEAVLDDALEENYGIVEYFF